MKPKTILLCLWAAAVISAGNAFAQSFCPLEPSVPPKTVVSLDAFKSIAILHEGRIKPVDSYARSLLLQFSGRTAFDRRPAYVWLAKLVFAPQATKDDLIFLINNPEIPKALGIEPQAGRRYSFMQLQPGLHKIVELAKVADQIDDKKRDVVDREIIRVYHNMVLYTQFSYVMTFAFPHPDFQVADPDVVRELGLPEGRNSQFSFVDVALRADALGGATANLEMGNSQAWTAREKILFRLLNSLYQWAQSYRGLPFHVVPSANPADESWLSPWDVANAEFYDTRLRGEIALLRDMAVHYWNGEQLPFDLSARAFQNSVAGRLTGDEQKAVGKISLELAYNKANFFLWAKALYGLSFFTFLFSLVLPGLFTRRVGLGLIGAGFFLHAVALILRIVIMARPPVSNLYETFIFVGFVSVLLGIVIELVNKQWLGIVVSSVCGLIFLLISDKFSVEGDTMKMLVAVLNSNFWLGTHVLSITIGYTGCCVAGIIGHVYLIRQLIRPHDKKRLESVYHNLVGALGFGLMMTFLGTMLGGIWADQSWGRFWGWDPKENGALLIVLWCTIIFHAKIAHLIGRVGVAATSVLGIIVVMWAWFGVNLLSIGLHSYGFTSGVASVLFGYAVIESLFVIASVTAIRRRAGSSLEG